MITTDRQGSEPLLQIRLIEFFTAYTWCCMGV
jgi:hypothetical protein